MLKVWFAEIVAVWVVSWQRLVLAIEHVRVVEAPFTQTVKILVRLALFSA
jgi:hypothetical protein